MSFDFPGRVVYSAGSVATPWYGGRNDCVMSKRPPFMKVAGVNEVPPGTVRHVLVHDKPMVLCNVEGQFYALNAVCPHMGGPLASGRLEGCVLACPWHGWTFDVRTGLPDHPGGHAVSAYEVRVEGEDVLVGWLKRPASD